MNEQEIEPSEILRRLSDFIDDHECDEYIISREYATVLRDLALSALRPAEPVGEPHVAVVELDRHGQTQAVLLDHHLYVGTKLFAAPPAESAEARWLIKALDEIAHWREKCHAFDDDMGNDARSFVDDEEWQMVETYAARKALAARSAQ